MSGGRHHEIGSDLEGEKPTFFDTGRGEDFKSVIRSDVKLKLKLALKTLIEDFGPEATILYNLSLNRELKETVTSMSLEGGAAPLRCYQAVEFYGCEADKVFTHLASATSF